MKWIFHILIALENELSGYIVKLGCKILPNVYMYLYVIHTKYIHIMCNMFIAISTSYSNHVQTSISKKRIVIFAIFNGGYMTKITVIFY